ncbi:hypothetical protein C8J56DRAFT_1054371 [Mycena floridula]|nr:hypothetical protein C8J56DRAFT_1054371 [Mycena floridula]
MQRPDYSAFFSSGLLAPRSRPLLAVDMNLHLHCSDTPELGTPLDDSSDVEGAKRSNLKSERPRLRRRRSSLSNSFNTLSVVKSPARKAVDAWNAPSRSRSGSLIGNTAEEQDPKSNRRRRQIPMATAPAPTVPLPPVPQRARSYTLSSMSDLKEEGVDEQMKVD